MAKEKRTRFIIEPSKIVLISRGIVSAAAIQNIDTARKLVYLAEHAYSLREMPTVEGIARHLSLADDPRVASAGQWFQAIARLRAGDKAEAEHLIVSIREG